MLSFLYSQGVGKDAKVESRWPSLIQSLKYFNRPLYFHHAIIYFIWNIFLCTLFHQNSWVVFEVMANNMRAKRTGQCLTPSIKLGCPILMILQRFSPCSQGLLLICILRWALKPFNHIIYLLLPCLERSRKCTLRHGWEKCFGASSFTLQERPVIYSLLVLVYKYSRRDQDISDYLLLRWTVI